MHTHDSVFKQQSAIYRQFIFKFTCHINNGKHLILPSQFKWPLVATLNLYISMFMKRRNMFQRRQTWTYFHRNWAKTKAFSFYPYYFIIINPILTYPLNSEIKFILKGREQPFKKAEKNHTARETK